MTNKKLVFMIYLVLMIYLVSNFFPGSCNAQSASSPWTLKDCLNFGLKNHPTLTQSESSIESAKAQIGQVRSGTKLKMSADASVLRRKSEFVRNSGPFGANLDMNDSTSESISARKLISDWGKSRDREKMVRSVLKASEEEHKWQTSQIAGAIKVAFFRALQNQALVKVQQDSLQRYIEHKQKVQGFLEVGSKTPYDLTRAEVDVANAKVSLIRSENEYKNSLAQLSQSIGIEYIPEITYNSNIASAATSHAELNKDDLVKKVMERPNLSAARFQLDSAGHQLSESKKALKPTLSGSANYGFDGTASPLDRSWSVAMSLTMPFLDGKLSKYQQKEAQSSLKAARARVQNLRIEAKTDLETAINSVDDAFRKFEVSQVLLKQASETLNLAEGRYEAGLGSPIEITDARSAYSNAEGTYISSYFDTLIALSRMNMILGELPPETNEPDAGEENIDEPVLNEADIDDNLQFAEACEESVTSDGNVQDASSTASVASLPVTVQPVSSNLEMPISSSASEIQPVIKPASDVASESNEVSCTCIEGPNEPVFDDPEMPRPISVPTPVSSSTSEIPPAFNFASDVASESKEVSCTCTEDPNKPVEPQKQSEGLQ
ncbi:MAG: TolC family protein [Candidatus Riflebacteria bacterium]|nr:TolC family protein [Candidatus Riflebacteria bacterium]